MELSFFPSYLKDDPIRVSHSPEQKADFPAMSSRHVPIRGDFPQEEIVILPSHDLFQFGNLNRHGAFWLEDRQGKILGMLRRERSPQTLGDKAPRTFYKISLELPDPDLNPKVRESIQHHLISDAVKQAKQNYFRLIVEPRSPEEATFLRQHKFINLDQALNRYVPKGNDNPAREHTGNWLVFDGVLDGYGANFFRRNAENSAISRS